MKSKKVSEPVQVYLDAPHRERLEWLTSELGASKSEVLRRALVALEQAMTDPDSHPLVRLIGIGVGDRGPSVSYDPIVEHDRYLAEANWPAPPPRRGGPRRGRA
ncbi:MAG: hypothetical protein AABY85_03210 [Gemmatimonadota bacterium]|jgi:hypothetical protein